MAKVSVEYNYSSTFVAVITIPDDKITEVLEEWKQDHEDGWEYDESDVKAAIGVLLENDYADALDPLFDNETGFGDIDWLDDEIIEPYAPNKVEQCEGQEELAL